MGLFISFEGPDGSGKTTITKYVSEYFMAKNIEVLCTREPGGIGISEKIFFSYEKTFSNFLSF